MTVRRTMYVGGHWPHARMFHACEDHDGFNFHPVEVTSIQDRPDFAPGDLVYYRGSGLKDKVDAPPFRDINNEWRVPLFNAAKTVRPSEINRVPEKKTFTITVRGVPDGSDLDGEIWRLQDVWRFRYGITPSIQEHFE